jgi:hypothetical protein
VELLLLLNGRAHPWLASPVAQNALAEVVMPAKHNAVVTATTSFFMGCPLPLVSSQDYQAIKCLNMTHLFMNTPHSWRTLRMKSLARQKTPAPKVREAAKA